MSVRKQPRKRRLSKPAGMFDLAYAAGISDPEDPVEQRAEEVSAMMRDIAADIEMKPCEDLDMDALQSAMA